MHPQSIVHSMVELVDGSMIAQLGVTDMRLPIQYAFSYPERWAAPLPPLDLARAGRLDFEAPDTTGFPCLALAFRALAGRRGAAGRAERRERDGGGGVPGGAAARFRDCRRHPSGDGRVRANGPADVGDPGRRAGGRQLGPGVRDTLDR